LKELRKPRTDPVVRENIMYSGHLHAITGMYTVLFGDDRYNAPGALTFRKEPVLWGMPQNTGIFEYHFSKLRFSL
jgi:hypothetical protein